MVTSYEVEVQGISLKMRAKILIIGPTPPPYHGVSVVTEMILHSDLQEKFKIVHLDTADRRGVSNIGRLDFTNVYLAIKHFFGFVRLCIKERPVLVYIPISQGTLGYLRDSLFLISAKPFHRKVVVHLHGGYFREFYDQSNKLMKLLIRWTLKDVKKAIVLGENLRYIFQGFVPEERIAVVSNGIEANFYIHKKSESNFKKGNRIRILFLSTLRRHRGFIDVVKAIPKVMKSHNEVEFVFAGEFYIKGRERDEPLKFIKEKRLSPFIVFTGIVTGEEKIRMFLSSDIFIFPSHNEGQPLVILEAMAAGLPVITTNTGAIKETVIDGENGFIIVNQNPNQIAEKIILLLKNEKLRKEMGKKSRERFLKYYTKDKFINNLSRVFKEVLAKSGKMNR